jgi:hypothetical protein
MSDNILAHYYECVEDFMKRSVRGERINRIDNINYRVAIREIYLYFAVEAFGKGDEQKYEDYNSRAKKANRQVMVLQSKLKEPSRRRPRPRRFSGLDSFGIAKRVANIPTGEGRLRRLADIWSLAQTQ